MLYAIKKQGVAAICYNHFGAFAICYILLNGLCYMLLHTPWGALLLPSNLTMYGCSNVSTTLSKSCENIIQDSYVSIAITLSGNFERRGGGGNV